MLQEYKWESNKEYFFENDNNWYIDVNKVKKGIGILEIVASEEELKQLGYIKKAELLKYNLAKGNITNDEYRINIVKLMKECYTENGVCILDETKIMKRFYKIINEIYKEDIE